MGRTFPRSVWVKTRRNGRYKRRSLPPATESEDPPMQQEIAETIRKLKNNKSGRENPVTAEMPKTEGERLEVWQEERMPRKWKELMICPIHIKKERAMRENNRSIALMDIVYKIIAIAIKNKLNEVVEKEIGQYQCGFRKYRSVIDQIFTLKQVVNNNVE
ncbi:hypothetical protein ILUMI_13352 [Ignelater luminosus]|uniref:Reverse transcriptase domain-containing protein n=1 Tax=Ignelater luminosus TaxID=2038154 RepID=A0A8K0CWE6_IGNLU|nr:hypothetical protein ILUMI_13352 [Ignelater luminosus]